VTLAVVILAMVVALIAVSLAETRATDFSSPTSILAVSASVAAYAGQGPALGSQRIGEIPGVAQNQDG
jgi:hypothetical protein